jgi:hypothetical protein
MNARQKHRRLISRNARSEASTVRRQDTRLSHQGAVAVVRAIPVRSAEASRPVRVADRCRTSPNAPTNEGSRRNIASVTVATTRSATSDAVRSICRGGRRKTDHRTAIVEYLAEVLLVWPMRHLLCPPGDPTPPVRP